MSRYTEVRTSREDTPSGCSASIMLPSQIEPPRGPMTSPKKLMISEPARRGRWRLNPSSNLRALVSSPPKPLISRLLDPCTQA